MVSAAPYAVTRPWAAIAAASFASAVAQGFGRFSYALLLPAVNADLLDSYALAGLLGSVNLAAYLVGTVVVSYASTRVGPATLMRFGLVGTTTGITTLALAPNAAVLFVGMVVAGFGGAFVWVPAPGLAGSVVTPAARGRAIGVVGAGIGAALLAGSLLTAAVKSVAGPEAWRPVWLIMAGVAAVALGVAVRWLRAPALEPGAGGTSLGALRSVPGWVAATVVYAAYGIALSIYLHFLVAALQDGGFSAGHAAAVFGAVGICSIPGGLLLGALSDRVGRRPALLLGCVLMPLGGVLVPLGAEPWAVVSAACFGLAMAGVPAVLSAHLADSLPPGGFAPAFGALTLAFGVAQLLGPQLGGWLREVTGGFTTVFLVATAAGAVSTLAAAGLPSRRRDPAAP